MKEDSEILRANKAAGRNSLEALDLEVLEVKKEAIGTYKVKLTLPSSLKDRFSNAILSPGSEIAIRPHISKDKLDVISKFLCLGSKADLKWLEPYQGYAGPELSTPSIDLLKLIIKKAHSSADTQIRKNAALLQAVLSNPEELKELQATYDVIDMLKNFPQMISAKDVWRCQPAAAQQRLYTVIPEMQESTKTGRLCFSISVRLSKALSPQRLFAENPVKLNAHSGGTSSWLCSLNKGDKVTVNKKIMSSFAYKKQDYLERPVIFISQGNATEGVLNLLKARRDYQKTLDSNFKNTLFAQSPCYLIAGFKTKDTMLGKPAIKEFLDDKTLSSAYIALSDEPFKKTDNEQGFRYNYGRLVTDIIPSLKINYPRQAIYFVEGSKTFCDCVKGEIIKLKGNSADIRVTCSIDRIKSPSTPEDAVPIALKPLSTTEIRSRLAKFRNTGP